MDLEDGHSYLFRAIEMAGDCGDDPQDGDCIRWEGAFLGQEDGSVAVVTIS